MPVAAVIPHRNSGDLLARCVDALAAGGCLREIVVADEDSTDGSVEAVAERPSVRVIRSRRPGFAAAANAGVEAADGERVLLLNSDAFVETDTVRRLDARLDADDRLAVCGAGLVDEHGSPSKTYVQLFTLRRAVLDALGYRWHPPQTGAGLQAVEAVLPTCALFRRDALDQVGGFDERFPFYYEDMDLALRLARAGWRQAVDWDARAVHLVGGSTSRRQPQRWFQQYHRSRLLYLRKHYPRGWRLYAAVWAVKATLHALAWSVRARWARSRSDRDAAELAERWADAFRRTIVPAA